MRLHKKDGRLWRKMTGKRNEQNTTARHKKFGEKPIEKQRKKEKTAAEKSDRRIISADKSIAESAL